MINIIEHTLNMDLANKINMNSPINIKQNDTNSHKFVINLFNSSVSHNLSDTTSRIYFKKPDGTKVFLSCVLDSSVNNKLSVLLTTQVLTAMGSVACEITIYGTSGEIQTSFTFNFNVLENIRDDIAIESVSEFTALTNALAVVTDFSNVKTEIVDARLGETTLKTKLQNVDSSLADILQQLQTSEAVNLKMAVAYAKAEKYKFELRSDLEFDAVANTNYSKSTIFPLVQGDLRAVKSLENINTNNFTIQAKIYYDGTQNGCYIGYNNLSSGTIAISGSQRTYVGISTTNGLGFCLNDDGVATSLYSASNLVSGNWYIITLTMINSELYTSITKEGSTQAHAYKITPSILNANNVQIGGYKVTDKIKDIKYIALNDASPKLLIPYFSNKSNQHTALTITISGIPTIVHLPASYNPSIKNKCCIWFHGSNGYSNDVWTYISKNNILNALLEAGYVVIGSDYTSRTCWGNAQSMTDITNLINYYKAQLNLQDEFYVYGESMGGAVLFNNIVKGIIKTKAVAFVSPAINLEYLYNNSVSLKSGIQGAFGITLDSEFQAKTDGYDPINDNDGSVFKNIPFKIYASYADTVVDRINDTDLFATKVNALGGNVSVFTVTGEHGDASGYQTGNVLDFFSQY